MRIALLPAFAIVAAASAGCTPSDGEGTGYVARDSAGVHIVENAFPLWRSDQRWRVDSTLISVGAAEGPPGQQLDRVTAAVRLRDGTLVIANAGSRQLLRYDARGAFLGATGREGEGPGEFRALTWLGRMRGDSLVTWDRGLDRVTVFTPKGEYARDYRAALSENPMSTEVKGGLDGGRLLMARGSSFISATGTSGVQRQPITAYVIDSTGVERASIGPFPGEAVFLEPARQGGGTIRMPVLLGAATLFATSADAVHVVDTEQFAVRTYTPDGKLVAITRRPHTAEPIEPGDIPAAIDAEMEKLPPVQAIRDGMRSGFERVPPPKNLPAVATLRVDADGNVWVQTGYRPAARDVAWSVFDPKSRWLGDVTLPAALTVLEIGTDYMIVRDRDEVDVERVRVMRLSRE